MSTATSTRPPELHAWRVPMTANPAAASEARGHVRAAIRAWQIPIDLDIAVLLTSELVTNAIAATPDADITLSVAAITSGCGSRSTTRHRQCPHQGPGQPTRKPAGA
jgi:hypothetical protein